MDIKYTSTSGGAYDVFLPKELNTDDSISLGVTVDGVPAGIIVVQLSDYHYEIVWLYIRRDVRRKGIGSGLVRELLSCIRKSNEIYPLSLRVNSDAEELFPFIETLECFDLNFECRRFFVSAQRRNASELVAKLSKHRKHDSEGFFEQSDLMLNRLYSTIADKGMNLRGLVSDNNDSFIRNLSLCHVGSRIDSLILVREIGLHNFEIVYAYSENKIHFAHLLLEVLKRISDSYEDANLNISALNQATELIVYHLFGADTPCSRLYRADWNYRLD